MNKRALNMFKCTFQLLSLATLWHVWAFLSGYIVTSDGESIASQLSTYFFDYELVSFKFEVHSVIDIICFSVVTIITVFFVFIIVMKAVRIDAAAKHTPPQKVHLPHILDDEF